MYPTGLLPLNKLVGLRSTRCVELIRKIMGKNIKAGHGGTLDSTASGLLVILIGRATRLSNFVMDMPKCYEAVAQLGEETTTDDASGETVCGSEWRNVDVDAVDSLLAGFMGWRMQAPPQISAVHVDGVRAHRLTRGGHEIELAEKPVFFSKIVRTSEISNDGRIAFRIYCHRGTYIRGFVRDIGRKLGCGAHVSSLNRLSVGPFTTANSKDSESLFGMSRDELTREILPVESLTAGALCYEPTAESAKRLANGLNVSLKDMRRVSLGEYASSYENLLVSSDDIFSVCERRVADGAFEVAPVTNIIYGRDI